MKTKTTVAVPSGDTRPKGVWLMAPPDNGLCTVTVTEIGSPPNLHWLGTSQLFHHSPPDIRAWPTLHLALGMRGRRRFVFPQCAINYLADADYFERTLGLVESVVRQMNVPCFNLPAAVRGTRRDLVAERLAGLEGLVVPKTARFSPRLPTDFETTFVDHGFAYPVIVRIAGTHGGKSQTLIEGPSQWERIFSLPWGGAHVYMTQFVDFRSADGLYRKLRLAFIGGRVLPRHLVAGRDWMVHAGDRLPDELAGELKWLAGFEAGFGAERRELFEEIDRRIGLDYFGMDCGVLDDGRLVLFEANATMAILRNTPPHESAFAPIVARLTDEVFSLVRDPGRWVATREVGTARASLQ